MPSSPDPKDQVQRWSDAAQYWEKHREIIKGMFAPVTDALIEDARISGGQTVLDVATGPGEPALSIAPLVGRVHGTDVVAPMIEAARRETERRGLTNAKFDAAPADHLPFPDATFDAVVSRFGIMFFPSPVDGVREMLRVLKPGGKLALAVWHTSESNAFFHTLSRVIDRYVEPVPPPPNGDMFRFARPGALLEVFREAGVRDASERIHRFNIAAPISVEELWTLRLELSESLKERVAGLSAEQMAEAKRQAIDLFRGYSSGNGVSFPAEVLIVSGSKS